MRVQVIRQSGFVLLVIMSPMSTKTAFADPVLLARQAIQAVCNRTCVYYRHRDLNRTMAMYAPALIVRTITGHTYNYRDTLAGYATDFAAHNKTIIQVSMTARTVSLRGAYADVLLDEHYASRYPGYMHSRDYRQKPSGKTASTDGRNSRLC